ncbi:hypothetical protein A4A49_23849 [Nicotiana attenuata]|uniref:Glabrous enhancer-binding protein-like DBD domain-containing protein n=1 Tax=Nicotiana attenuata TaxID=49451 RepID=A0A1J6KCB7_NICAT|nr:hypothetical protein A4A49_23849 [Nicotiana attenuata]
MLGADEEPNSPEGGGVSSSSSTPSHDNGDMMDQNLLENGAFDLSCPESFTQIMEQAEELVISDACSTNCTGNIERKRRRTATDEQEDEEGINNATVEFIVPKFSKFEKGGPSDTPEGRDQTQQNDNDQLNNEDQYDEDHQVLAILKSMWHFNCNNGYFPYPTSDELHNHIMDSVSNLKILGEDLTNKIIALEDNFNTVRDLDGDNPDGDRPIHREIFDLSMQLWGNSDVEQQNQELYDVNIEQNTSADDLEGWSWW